MDFEKLREQIQSQIKDTKRILAKASSQKLGKLAKEVVEFASDPDDNNITAWAMGLEREQRDVILSMGQQAYMSMYADIIMDRITKRNAAERN